MSLKGYLQSSYQNVLNLDDISFTDYQLRKIHTPSVRMKLFASNLQLINRLHKEGKMNAQKALTYIENQKRSIKITLLTNKNLSELDIEKAVETTVKNIVQL